MSDPIRAKLNYSSIYAFRSGSFTRMNGERDSVLFSPGEHFLVQLGRIPMLRSGQIDRNHSAVHEPGSRFNHFKVVSRGMVPHTDNNSPRLNSKSRFTTI
ncbi:hypothetical protein D3C81_2009910 [compost metagenome]